MIDNKREAFMKSVSCTRIEISKKTIYLLIYYLITAMSEEKPLDLKSNLSTVRKSIETAVVRRSNDLPQITPTLVAASKIKPVSLIIQAYDAGQRHFGENYVTELAEKANDPQILEKCKEIKWHFIGHLQTNKINKLLASPGFFMVQTVDSEKLADNLNKQWAKIRSNEEKLNVLAQINTSGEEVKSGVPPSEATNLVAHILKNCPNLHFNGLMTIGEYYYDTSKGPNPDFLMLAKCRQEICKELNLNENEVELSMGMSCDFEQAIELGATIVRVGSNIFGQRPPKNTWKHEQEGEHQPCFQSSIKNN